MKQSASTGPIQPGSTVGVLGGGQLGRMFAIAARQMGYRVHTLSPNSDTPTGQVADLEIAAPYDDLDAVRKFAAGVSVMTFEFENVLADAAAAAAERTIVRPAGDVLHTTQNRIREKTFLARHGFPVTPFAPVHNSDELRAAIDRLGLPGVLKTAEFGYDGKGQATVRSADEAARVLADGCRAGAWVYEAFIDFEREISVVAARGTDGAFAHWGAIENAHHNHILDVSIAPADIEPTTAESAVEIARGILEQLGVVGVLCVEFFLTRSGKLLVNELAPRPHNSGHLTIDASVTSQFEQQLRAVCGLPLGSAQLLRPTAMANLLGDLWSDGEPNWPGALAEPNVKLHLYGKKTPRPGRKMGHLTATAETTGEAARIVKAAREALRARR